MKVPRKTGDFFLYTIPSHPALQLIMLGLPEVSVIFILKKISIFSSRLKNIFLPLRKFYLSRFTFYFPAEKFSFLYQIAGFKNH